MSVQLFIAARGWDHDAWAGSLYPEDLPQQWRLSYYANEFRSVLVPFDDWSEACDDTVLQWREDTSSGFRFFLALPPHGRIPQGIARLRALGDRLGGLVIEAPGEVQAGPLASHPPWAEGQAAGEPSSAGSFGSVMGVPVAAYGIEVQVPAGPLAVMRLAPASSVRALREQIAGFVSRAASCTCALMVLHGEPPDAGILRQARQIGELLGH